MVQGAERALEVKFRGRLGPEQRDDKSVRILNRVVEWGPDGIRYEADQRHAEIIVRDLEIPANTKRVNTPSVAQVHKNVQALTPREAGTYRAIVARANYLAQDRADIAYTVKELCRNMSAPRACDWEALRRLGRYFKG